MQETVPDQISAALELARLAVEADSSEDYGEAIRKYRETIRAMEKVRDRISQEGTRTLLSEKLQKYRQRLELLEGLFPTLGGRLVVGGGPSTASRPPARAPPTQPAAPTTTSPAVHVTPSTLTAVPPPWKTHNLTPPVSPSPITNAGPTQTIFFVEEEIHFSSSKSLEPPDSPNQRTFWLIHLLHQTMATGGFLTPKLYVSMNVWEQKGAKFSAVQTKMSCLQSVMEGLCKLSNVDINNVDDCLRNLDEYCGVVNGVQNMLAKHLSYIKESKDEKKGLFKSVGTGMARLKTNLSSASTDDGYILLLRETLAKTSILDKWLARYENGTNSKQVWELLSRVCDFFYSVVISFVIRDFNMLLARYMKKCNESFFEEWFHVYFSGMFRATIVGIVGIFSKS